MKFSREGVVALVLFIASIIAVLVGFNKIITSSNFGQYFVGAGLLIAGLTVSIVSGVNFLTWWNRRNKPTHTEILEEAKLEAGIRENHDAKK